jgi:DNA repair photolyase
MISTKQQAFVASPLIWTDERVFISPSIGCPARCPFCYLPEVDADKPRSASLSPEELADMLRSDLRFKAGHDGTVLSLGCLSEPLATHSIRLTTRFLEAVRGLTNPLQVATRWAPSEDEQTLLLDILQGFQSVVFHSMVEWGDRVLEIGTPAPKERARFIDAVARADVRSVLYLKPFIAGHTPKFTARFIELAARYRIRHLVIGPLFLGSNTTKMNHPMLQQEIQANGFLQEEFPVGLTPNQPLRGSDQAKVSAVAGMSAAFMSEGISVHNHSLQAIKEIYERNH